MGPYSITVKWKSTKRHAQNEMEASLSLCKHSTQTTDGGWQSRLVEKKGHKVKIESRNMDDHKGGERRVTVVKGWR